MQTNYTGRVTLILVVLWAALSLIFPSVPPSIFWFFKPNQTISLHPNLRPGIDMVGGTSLLYEIKSAPGSTTSGDANLAERVMEALKKRVDPQGVRNLIWRPQGNRLEIQMPLSGRTGDSKAKREAYHQAEGAVDATNIRLNQ